MNNFTKEELIEIKRCVKCVCNSGFIPYSSFTLEINKKLQPMIDNYCDHDGEIGKDYPAEKCIKCNRMWE